MPLGGGVGWVFVFWTSSLTAAALIEKAPPPNPTKNPKLHPARPPRARIKIPAEYLPNLKTPPPLILLRGSRMAE